MQRIFIFIAIYFSMVLVYYRISLFCYYYNDYVLKIVIYVRIT